MSIKPSTSSVVEGGRLLRCRETLAVFGPVLFGSCAMLSTSLPYDAPSAQVHGPSPRGLRFLLLGVGWGVDDSVWSTCSVLCYAVYFSVRWACCTGVRLLKEFEELPKVVHHSRRKFSSTYFPKVASCCGEKSEENQVERKHENQVETC